MGCVIINAQPIAIDIKDDMIRIRLAHERIIAAPLAWYPWLASATPEQQANYKLGISVLWPDLDEGIDIEALMRIQ